MSKKDVAHEPENLEKDTEETAKKCKKKEAAQAEDLQAQVEELQAKLEEAAKKQEETKDQLLRTLAEYDNYRKRTEKEKGAMFEVGAKSVLEKLLPVVDNFERGLSAVPEDEKESATAVGMDKIYKQLMTALKELEVEPIEAVGKEFSPDFHNAVMQAQEEGVGENIVVAEFQKGYMYRGSVLRYSMVKVNQ